MKIETVKTYLLVSLVGISFILTFSLWSYQPNDDYLYNAELVDEEDFSLGGDEKSKRDLVAPSNIVFEHYDQYYGFPHPLDQQALYREIQSWVLYDYREMEANGRPNNNNQVEVIFPMPLSMEMVPSIFTLNDDIDELPTWSFQRFYITFESNRSLTFHFLSIDGREQVRFNVNNPAGYDLLWDYAANLDGLVDYMIFHEVEKNPIYMPEDDVTMSARTVNLDKVSPQKLVNALFPSPSEVIRNISDDNESFYQDGQRTMRVISMRGTTSEARNMEYTNPQEARSFESISSIELLDRSIDNINSYRGWINQYRLETIDTRENSIRYQLFFGGYPVYGNEDLTYIQQQWRNSELYQYRSPLITLNNTIHSEEVELDSGTEISYALKNNSNYDLDNIQDIRLGLKFSLVEYDNPVIELIPAWFMNYNGYWQEISVEDITQGKGVS